VEAQVVPVDLILAVLVEAGITQMQHGVGKRVVMQQLEHPILVAAVVVALGMVGMEIMAVQV
jgi:hypothetical protein